MDTKTVCIIGAGTTGLSLAHNLVRSNVEVALIDRNPYPGGHAVDYGCKATDTCMHCGVCLVRDALTQLQQNPRLKTLYSSIPRTMGSHADGRFEIDIESPDNHQSTISADAVVVATGFTPFNPSMNRKWGYGDNARVITASDLERLFYEEQYFPENLSETPRTIAFVQCVGSRNIMEGVAQCSRICCTYALRMAGRLKHEFPDSEIDFYYMDIQRLGKDFETLWATVSDSVNFIRSNPISIEINAEGKPLIRFESIPGNRCEKTAYDLVVLSHGLCPSDDRDELAEMCDLDLDSNGFFAVPQSQQKAPLDRGDGQTGGIFVAGTCRGPMTIAECVEDASNVSEQILEFLKEVTYGKDGNHV